MTIEGIPFAEYEQQWMDALEIIKEIPLIDSEHYINTALDEGKKIIAEGAQGSLLDIDFGSYPFVTSSNTTTAAVCTGLGVAPSRVGKVFGVFKAYCTRVGSGPFPSELNDATGQRLRDSGHEYGATTGRPRRCGWLDMPALRYAVMLNGVTDLVITKADVLDDFDEIKVCMAYELNGIETEVMPYEISVQPLKPVYITKKGWKKDLTTIRDFDGLPVEYKDYISFIENKTGVPVTIVSTGPDREQTIIK
jgi:adenylosuccinate synthase